MLVINNDVLPPASFKLFTCKQAAFNMRSILKMDTPFQVEAEGDAQQSELYRTVTIKGYVQI